eukprot:12408433-Karenia_brevis.AAC.1
MGHGKAGLGRDGKELLLCPKLVVMPNPPSLQQKVDKAVDQQRFDAKKVEEKMGGLPRPP